MTHLFCIIDRSGSMTGLEKVTVDGYNEFVKGLKKEKGVKLTQVLFDHEYQVIVDSKKISDVQDMVISDFVPRGSTALIDAVCRTLNERKGQVKKNDKALVLIITDGFENASRENTSKDLQDLVHGLEAQGNWTFTYLGANQDAWSVAQDWGFKKGNVSSFNATSAGASAGWSAMSANTAMYARGATMSVGDFYEKDKTTLESTK